jgi:hypothetical protein
MIRSRAAGGSRAWGLVDFLTPKDVHGVFRRIEDWIREWSWKAGRCLQNLLIEAEADRSIGSVFVNSHLYALERGGDLFPVEPHLVTCVQL